MTDLTKKTKGDLIAEIGALSAELESWRNAPTKTPAVPVRVPEADALAGCIRALDVLQAAMKDSHSNSNFGYNGVSYNVRTSAIDRVLRSLAAKYDVPLIEVQVRDCNRAHVDRLDFTAIQNALAASQPVRP